MPAYGELLPSNHPSGWQASTRDLMFQACMHGEDYIISTQSFDGFDEYMNRVAKNLSSRVGQERLYRPLYDFGLNCARDEAKRDSVEIPSQYMIK